MRLFAIVLCLIQVIAMVGLFIDHQPTEFGEWALCFLVLTTPIISLIALCRPGTLQTSLAALWVKKRRLEMEASIRELQDASKKE
jgi:ABC-type transport system involved in cytochrome c biogenesis permease component